MIEGDDAPLAIRYCKQSEVNSKRQKFIVFKQKFLIKQTLVKSQGQKFTLLKKVRQFIDSNIDHLFANRIPQFDELVKKEEDRARL